MDLAHEYKTFQPCTFLHPSFNPCFNGSCSRILFRVGTGFPTAGFNPCFNGSCSRINNQFQKSPDADFVSILVLMDLAHEFLSNIRQLVTHFGFNPCFNGSCSRIFIHSFLFLFSLSFNPCFNGSCSRIFSSSQVAIFVNFVSILVLMDLAHESPTPLYAPGTELGFNPCFNGSCSRIIQRLALQLITCRFNPCFNGSCSRIRRLETSHGHIQVSILVLMDLAHESGYVIKVKKNIIGFNPCFNGSCSRIVIFLLTSNPISCFNPCFNGSCSRIRFVYNWALEQKSFNPCFNGSCSRIWIILIAQMIVEVSILVLMDLAHE